MKTLKESILSGSGKVVDGANINAKEFSDLKSEILNILHHDITGSIVPVSSRTNKSMTIIRYSSAPSSTRIFNRINNDILKIKEKVERCGLYVIEPNENDYPVKGIAISNKPEDSNNDGTIIFLNVQLIKLANRITIFVDESLKGIADELTRGTKLH